MPRLILTSVILAAKCYDDLFYNNEYYSKVGGISCKELNSLEAEMLQQLDYDLHVLPECYDQYLLKLQEKYLLDTPSDTALLERNSEEKKLKINENFQVENNSSIKMSEIKKEACSNESQTME